jgi:hypothetical protein
MAIFDVTVRIEINDETLAMIRSDERGEAMVEKHVRLHVTDELFNGDADENGRFVIGLREVGEP